VNEYKFVLTSNHTFPHKAIVAAQTASDRPTFHYKCIVLCKTALGSNRESGGSNRKEKGTIFVYI